MVLSAQGYVLFDDTVLDKHHSRRIGLVRRQYSGNAHGVIAGIGLVTCVYVNADTDQFWLIDYRSFCLRPRWQDQTRARGRDAGPVGPARHRLSDRAHG